MSENNENEIEEQEEVDAETAAFNSMLNAAQKKLGISSEPQSEESESEDKPDRETVKSAKKVLGTGGKLSQQQIEALLNDDGMEDPEAEPETETQSEPDTQDAPQKPAEADPDDPDYDDTDEIASILGAGIQQSIAEPEEPVTEKEPEPEAEPKPKKNILGPIITIAAVLVALALGFCVAMLMFSDIIKTGNEQFAIRAANALNSTLPVNSELYICKSYVKNSSSGNECMLYFAKAYGSDVETGMCRVSVTHDKPNTVNIYYTVDESSAEYLAMKGSDDPEVRLQASFIKNYSDTVYAADKAIQIASPQWEKIDCTRINRNINSEQDDSIIPPQEEKPAAASAGNEDTEE